MTTANQIGFSVVLGFIANALYWWAIQPAWRWLIDRIIPVDPPLFIGQRTAAVHLHAIGDDHRPDQRKHAGVGPVTHTLCP